VAPSESLRTIISTGMRVFRITGFPSITEGLISIRLFMRLHCDFTKASTHEPPVPGVFAAGDMRRGQSLVVWAITEGRKAARGGCVSHGREQAGVIRRRKRHDPRALIKPVY
jgi:hypothetical protein